MKTTNSGSGRRTLSIALACAAAVLFAGSWHLAVANPNARELPSTAVAVIDLERLIAGLEEKEQLEQRFRAQLGQRQEQLDEINTRMRQLEQDLEMIAVNDPARRRKLEELRELEILGRARQELVRGAMEEQHGELMRGMVIKALDAASRVGERDGWDLILIDDRELAQVPGDGRITADQLSQLLMARQVMYASDRIDITDQIITKMNNEFKAGRQ